MPFEKEEIAKQSIYLNHPENSSGNHLRPTSAGHLYPEEIKRIRPLTKNLHPCIYLPAARLLLKGYSA